MKRPDASQALAVAAGLVIVALTAAAFWLSYAHLAEVALAHGMEDKEIRAWAWPATLDLFIVAGELLMLRAALAGKVDPWAIGLTVVGSGSSIALNVAGVGTAAGTLDYVVAAVPPTAALLAFGALMRQIHQALAKRAEPVSTAVDIGPEVTTEVTVERVADDQPRALVEAPEVVPAGARMLPIVARPEPVEMTTQQSLLHVWKDAPKFPRDSSAPRWTVAHPVMPPVPALESGTFWSATKASDLTAKATAAVPAETAREVVTQVIALTPAELRRKARALNKEAVRSNGRPVTIKTLQDELGLSRREATDLRREVVTATLFTGEARP